MTKPTGVREIIEGIRPIYGDRADLEKAFETVIAIALLLERRRNDYAELAMRAHHEEEIVRDNERLKAIAKGEA